MRKFTLLLIAILGLTCCKREVDQAEIVGAAATQYYGYLLEGNYDAFIDGTFREDTLRPFYRLQLIENAKMFVAQQKRERGGILSAEIQSVELDTAAHTANVFLTLNYGDKTTERILLPMLQHDGLWYMR